MPTFHGGHRLVKVNDIANEYCYRFLLVFLICDYSKLHAHHSSMHVQSPQLLVRYIPSLQHKVPFWNLELHAGRYLLIIKFNVW